MSTPKTYKAMLPEITLKYKSGNVQKIKVTGSKDIVEIAKTMFNTDTIEINEEVIVIFLNRANNTLGWMRHTTGGSVGCMVDIKMILVTALNCGAQSIILMHNHPSGIKFPSEADKNMSKKLKVACEAIELTLLDSIVVTPEYEYFSFADEYIL
jgi:DNA repair protein RadC